MPNFFVRSGFFFCIGFLTGHVIAWQIRLPKISFWWVCFGLVVTLVCVIKRFSVEIPLGLLFITSVVSGVLNWQTLVDTSEYQDLYDQSFNSYAKVIQPPSYSNSGNQVVLVLPDGYSQNIRLSLFKESYVHLGDRVLVSGILRKPENFSDFDYINFLKKDNVYAELKNSKLFVILPQSGVFRKFLQKTKDYAAHRYRRLLSTDESDIAMGMLLGVKPKQQTLTMENFRKVGLTHILVVSGFNLAVVANAVGVLASLIGRKKSDLLSLFLIWLFVLFVGMSGSVIRAGIMSSVVLISRILGRASYSNLALLWAVCIMTAINPSRVFYDIGLQLSIAATFGVVQAGKLAMYFERKDFTANVVYPTLGAILFTAPIVAYYFEVVSIVSPLVNLLVVPLVPIIMLLSALLLIPFVGLLVKPIVSILISFMIWSVNFFGSFSFSTVRVSFDSQTVIGILVSLWLITLAFTEFRKQRLKKTYINARMNKITI